MGRKVFIGDKVACHINTGGQSVGTSLVALSSNDRKLDGGVQIVADAGNSGVVYVGVRKNLTAGSSNSLDGFPLSAGESVLLPVQKESEIQLISDSASQGVHFLSF